MSGISRRDFLVAAGGAFLLGCTPDAPVPRAGALLGPDGRTGHRLRDGGFPAPVRHSKVQVLVAGAGIAGLSCGWWLRRNGFADFRLLELETAPGGNARYGANAVSQFPWGAHYLPLPGPEAEYVRLLLADLGAIQGSPLVDAPVYDERLIVNAPAERLFIHGAWHDSLQPRFGIGAAAVRDLERFERLMQEWTQRKGRDGRHAFSIPSPLSSTDPDFLALDRITMQQWMLLQGLKSEALHWYVSYCCRDDYGAGHDRVSAWAGLHYFCSRRGSAANTDAHSVLTAPNGNGWIVRQLAERLQAQLQTGRAVVRLETAGNRLQVDVFDVERQEIERIECEHVVWAAPSFVLARIFAAARAMPQPEYAPWLIANLTLRNVDENEFTAWDSVIYQGEGLGYVDATHQKRDYRRPDRVLTYYHALSRQAPREARQQLLSASHESWSRRVFADLKKAHPGLERQCTSVDLWRWPHAMAIPAPGFRSATMQRQRSLHPRLHVAHSDMSGFSILEEAQYWGVRAAKAVLAAT